MVTSALQVEFDRPLMLDRITTDEVRYQDKASDDERMAIAQRLDIPAVNTLAYDLTVSLVHKETTVAIRGAVRASVTLECSLVLRILSTRSARMSRLI